MGLNHWAESDSASDFMFVIRQEMNKLIKRELRDQGNEWNTCGADNVALGIKSGDIGLNMVTQEQYTKILEHLQSSQKANAHLRAEYAALIKAVKKHQKESTFAEE